MLAVEHPVAVQALLAWARKADAIVSACCPRSLRIATLPCPGATAVAIAAMRVVF